MRVRVEFLRAEDLWFQSRNRSAEMKSSLTPFASIAAGFNVVGIAVASRLPAKLR